ncbi:MAG TPA: isoprenylcysteine carboxylmethyltransferase family protein [Gemmatimonadaceae bacterium]|nr:isoprenylcysteine carboxylmethyltransferase family protein [Gemmatimonadaceae bacterium]
MPTTLPNPGVRFPPPFLFAGGWLTGWLLHRAWPLPLAAGAPPGLEAAALTLGAAGLALAMWGLLTFARVRTAIIPHHPARRLVVRGPYRFTRNPMYVGLTALYVALALLARSWWPLLLLPAVLALLVALVIRREERYLASAFGAEYEAYRRRVRRWL